MSIEAVRVYSIGGQEIARRGFKRTYRKNCFKNSGTNQNVLVLFQNFLIKWKSSAFVLQILENIKMFSICFKDFRLHRNIPISI